jgi:uncharacterized membrane protein (UPF0136 family)
MVGIILKSSLLDLYCIHVYFIAIMPLASFGYRFIPSLKPVPIKLLMPNSRRSRP